VTVRTRRTAGRARVLMATEIRKEDGRTPLRTLAGTPCLPATRGKNIQPMNPLQLGLPTLPNFSSSPSSSSATNDYSESRSEWTRILDRYGSRLVMNKLVTVWHVVSTRVLFFETVSYPIYIYIYAKCARLLYPLKVVTVTCISCEQK